jgi:hypothetical protein
MPHLSQLQETHASDGVTVIGVTRPDRNNAIEAVRKMTADKADVMRYHVAWDGDGKTYEAFMTASGSNGIPQSFLVDREGRIAAIGHPSQMDMPLAMVVAGTWDPIESPKRLKEAYGVIGDIYRYTGGGLSDKQKEKVVKGLATFEKDYAEFMLPLRGPVFELYLSIGHKEKVASLGAAWLADATKHKDAADLNQLAWILVDPESTFEDRSLDLAMKAAVAAVEASKSKDPAILDTLARAHSWRGEWQKAIAVQRKAVETAREAELEDMAEELEWTLEEYLGEVEETVETPGK